MTEQVQQGAPRFALKLGGTQLDNTQLRHISSISFSESMDKLDALSIQFAVPTVNQNEVFDHIGIGNTFEIELGYAGAGTTRMGYGDITEVSHTISPSAPWSITLTGLDALHRLKGNAQTKVWEDTHSDIVRAIAGEHSMGTTNVSDVESSPEQTFQDNLTDAVFLRRLATEHHYFVRVIDTELHFGRLSLESVTTPLEVEWNKEIENLSLRGSINGLVNTVQIKGSNYTASNPAIEAEYAASELTPTIERGQLGTDIVAEHFGDREHLVDNARRNQSSDADTRARREMESRADKFLTGSMSVLGKPDAVSGAKIEIKGLKWPFTGPYLITQTTHTLTPGVGYRTKIDFKSNCWPPTD